MTIPLFGPISPLYRPLSQSSHTFSLPWFISDQFPHQSLFTLTLFSCVKFCFHFLLNSTFNYIFYAPPSLSHLLYLSPVFPFLHSLNSLSTFACPANPPPPPESYFSFSSPCGADVFPLASWPPPLLDAADTCGNSPPPHPQTC